MKITEKIKVKTSKNLKKSRHANLQKKFMLIFIPKILFKILLFFFFFVNYYKGKVSINRVKVNRAGQ